MLSNVGYIRGRGQQFLVAPSVFRNPLAITRAQLAGVQSSAVNGTNDGLTFYGADTPRFNGAAQRLLIGGQRTNGIRNPRQEGAAVGTPGTSPTNMARNIGGGMTQGEIVAIGADQGLPYVDYRITGTVASGTGIWALALEGTTSIPALTGQTWTGSWFWRLVDVVSGGPSAWSMIVTEADSGGALVLENTVSMTAPTTASLGSQRVSGTQLLSGGASVAFVRTRVRLSFPVGTHDITIRIAVPQLEQGPFASSPILPPAGTPGASTRGADIVGASLSSLGIAANGACTILWHGVVPVFLPSGNIHTIACIDNGSAPSSFNLLIATNSGTLEILRFNGGGAQQTVGAVTVNTTFKTGITLNGAGRAAASLNGGAVAAVTGGPTSGLTQFRLGNISDTFAPMWGETGRLRILPYSVSDAELQSLVGAL